MTALTRFRKRYREFASLPATEEGEGFKLGNDIFFTQEEAGWAVYFPEAHAHFKSLGDGLWALARLLYGMGRTVEEYRGDLLAQAWIEFSGEYDDYHAEEPAVYLDPFDSEEWVLREGEYWKQVLTRRRYDEADGMKVEKWQDFSYHPRKGSGSMVNWLSDCLGPPQAWMRWVVTGHSRFIVQAPVGWRKVPAESSVGHTDFMPEEGDFIFRVIAYFRESEKPHPVALKAATRPKSIDVVDGEEAEGWQLHAWNLLFSDGKEDMLGAIYLYCHPEEVEEAEICRQMVEASLPHCLMTPTTDWDCRTIA